MCCRAFILCKLPKPMTFVFFNPSHGAERALSEAKLTNVLPQAVSVGKTGQVNWRLRPPKQELCDGLTKVVSLYLVQLEEPRTHPTKLVKHLCVPLPTAASPCLIQCQFDARRLLARPMASECQKGGLRGLHEGVHMCCDDSDVFPPSLSRNCGMHEKNRGQTGSDIVKRRESGWLSAGKSLKLEVSQNIRCVCKWQGQSRQKQRNRSIYN